MASLHTSYGITPPEQVKGACSGRRKAQVAEVNSCFRALSACYPYPNRYPRCLPTSWNAVLSYAGMLHYMPCLP